MSGTRAKAIRRAAAPSGGPDISARPKMSPLSFADVMESAHLFGRWFQESSWNAWKVFGRAFFGLPLGGADAEVIWRRRTQRQAVPVKPFREGWLQVGRRGGKSLVAAALAVFAAAFKDYTGLLKPGQRGYVFVLAADSDQAMEVMNYIAGFLDEVPALAGLVEKRRGDVIRLRNRITIKVQVASFRRLRGRTVVAAICDEIASWYDGDHSANPANEVLRALRPSMLNVPGAFMVCISSPLTRRGVMWDAYRQSFGKDDGRVLYWTGETLAMNPGADRAEIDAAYERDPAAAKAEYGAQWRDDLETFASVEMVEAVTIQGRIAVPYEPGRVYYGALDTAGGGGGDSLAGVITTPIDGKSVVCAMFERRPRFDAVQVGAEVADFFKGYSIVRVKGDNFSGDTWRSILKANGITHEVYGEPTGKVYRDFLPLLTGQKVELPDQTVNALARRMVAQLLDLQQTTSPSGTPTVTHPREGHDDLIAATAMACLMAQRPKMLAHEGQQERARLAQEVADQQEGVREVIRVISGVRVVFRRFEDGREVMDRVIPEDEVKALHNGFATCPKCKEQYLDVGDGHTCRTPWSDADLRQYGVPIPLAGDPPRPRDPKALHRGGVLYPW